MSASAEEDAGAQAVLGDSCVWAAASQKCVAPRSCFDCLNVPVAGGKCAVNSLGVCVSTHDLHLHEVSTGEYWASDEAEYCGADDADCAACRSAWAAEFDAKGRISSDAVCATASGCTCLWVCSEAARHDSILSAYCSLLSSDQLLLFSGLALGMLAVFVVLALVLRVWLRKHLERQDEQRSSSARRRRRHLPRREPKGPLLQLAGWNSMLDKLIESEQGAADDARPRLARAPTLCEPLHEPLAAPDPPLTAAEREVASTV